jgi:hypothetical protein
MSSSRTAEEKEGRGRDVGRRKFYLHTRECEAEREDSFIVNVSHSVKLH